MSQEPPASAASPPPPGPPPRWTLRDWLSLGRRHREDVGLLVAALNLITGFGVGILAIVVSIIVARIAEDQRRIQEATVLPLISVQSQRNEYNNSKKDLVVQNHGGPLNHLQVESWSFVTVHLRLTSEPDSAIAFIPLVGHVKPIALTYRVQGIIAKADAEDVWSYFEEGLGARVFADSTVTARCGSLGYLVHLAYDDLRERHYDRYVVVDSKDFRYVDARRARQLADTLDARMKAGNAINGTYSDQAAWLAVARRTTPSARRGDAVLLRTLESRK